MTRRAWLLVAAAVAALAIALGVIVQRRRARAEALRAIDVAKACPTASPLGPACGPCIAAFCCRELSACWGSTECIDLNDCWVKSGEEEGEEDEGEERAGGDAKSRVAACMRKHPGGVAAFRAWDDCARSRCERECPRGPEEK